MNTEFLNKGITIVDPIKVIGSKIEMLNYIDNYDAILEISDSEGKQKKFAYRVNYDLNVVTFREYIENTDGTITIGQGWVLSMDNVPEEIYKQVHAVGMVADLYPKGEIAPAIIAILIVRRCVTDSNICDIMSQLSPIDKVDTYEEVQEIVMNYEDASITARDLEKRNVVRGCLNGYEALAVGRFGVDNLTPDFKYVLSAEDQVDDPWFFNKIKRAFASIKPDSVRRYNSNPQLELWPNMMGSDQKVQFESLHFWFDGEDEVVFNFKNKRKTIRHYCSEREDWAWEKTEPIAF